MQKELYSQKKAELSQLLIDSLTSHCLSPSGEAFAASHQHNLNEDAFKVVLIGEFQGGKSTTFDAICDGREISPRGAMIKTSACLITARNLADQSVAEFARITWKTDDEILSTMTDFLVAGLVKIVPERFAEFANYQDVILGRITDYSNYNFRQTPQPLKLKERADRELVYRVLEEEWQSYRDAPADYDVLSPGRSDMLKASTLMIHYYDEFEQQRNNRTLDIPLSELAKYVTFPMTWTQWDSRITPIFSSEQTLFAQISRVDCYLHSKNLEKMGCVIIDCPGLFASEWDTRVANMAMNEADAIIYLFGGERAINEGEIQALNQIKKLKRENVLFYGFNSHILRILAERDVVPASQAKLQGLGFTFNNGGISVFHALLGLCSQNRFIISNDDGFSQKHFSKCSERVLGISALEDTSSIRSQVIESQLGRFCTAKERKELCVSLQQETEPENSAKIDQMLFSLSNIGTVFHSVEELMLREKSHSLLITNGAKKLQSHLFESQKELLEQIALDKKTADEVLKVYEKAKAFFDGFIDEATKEVNSELEHPAFVFPLKDDFLKSVFHPDEIATELGNVLAADIMEHPVRYSASAVALSGIKVWTFVTGSPNADTVMNSYIGSRIKEIFSQVFTRHVQSAAENWSMVISRNENRVFTNEFGYTIEHICNNLADLWRRKQDSIKGDETLDFAGMSFPSDLVQIGQLQGSELSPGEVSNGIMLCLAALIGGGYLGYQVAVLAGAVVFGIISELAGGWIITLVAIIVGVIVTYITGVSITKGIAQKTGAKISENIVKHIREGLENPDVKKQMENAADKVARNFIVTARKFFEDKFVDAEKRFEQKWASYNANAKATAEERNSRISANQKKLESIVIPLLNRCEKYIYENEPLCR